eukprot:scaffold393_cov147-Skeletonema_marinoi.AAC.7
MGTKELQWAVNTVIWLQQTNTHEVEALRCGRRTFKEGKLTAPLSKLIKSSQKRFLVIAQAQYSS